MTLKRKVEVFSAGCAVCEETIATVRRLACDSCDVAILDMRDLTVARRARDLGIHALPAVVVDGRLAACCAGGPTEAGLRAAGIGSPPE